MMGVLVLAALNFRILQPGVLIATSYTNCRYHMLKTYEAEVWFNIIEPEIRCA
jgi:hypothetical protein